MLPSGAVSRSEHDVSDKDAKATLDNIYLTFIFLFPLSCYSFQFISWKAKLTPPDNVRIAEYVPDVAVV